VRGAECGVRSERQCVGRFLPAVRVALVLAVLVPTVACGGEEQKVIRYAADGSDLQAVLDAAPAGATVVCDTDRPLTVTRTLVIRKPLTLKGLHARLPEKLGRTVLLQVEAGDVTLTDLELHGNYDSVPQTQRAPLVCISRGGFRVERCRFYDGTKDGVTITPEPGKGDLVGGTVRDVRAWRMGRDAVSISGGNRGSRVRNVTVEDVCLTVGYHRGAVEVSDGTDHITVRNVVAEKCVYALDVQDHGGKSAPNTNILAENLTAVESKHIVRTANSPRGHANLTLKHLVGKRVRQPVVVKHTRGVLIDGLRLDPKPAAGQAIQLHQCHDVTVRNADGWTAAH